MCIYFLLVSIFYMYFTYPPAKTHAFIFTYQGQGKRVQHVGPTSSNMLDKKCLMRLRTMLDDVGPTYFLK